MPRPDVPYRPVSRAARATLLLLPVLAGCAAPMVSNPSFPLDGRDAREALADMRAEPRALSRPVVVLAGYADPGFASGHVAGEILTVAPAATVLPVAVGFEPTFDSARRRLLDAVAAALPQTDPVWTPEVDVVAMSMGGLVARYAAAAVPGDARRLRIARLFTIATPHRGARGADASAFDGVVADMRPGSGFLARLDAAYATDPYPVVPYVILGDRIVGADNAAPLDAIPWWLPPEPASAAHLTAYLDPRILADILRRLRGEPAFTVAPPAPLPEVH